MFFPFLSGILSSLAVVATDHSVLASSKVEAHYSDSSLQEGAPAAGHFLHGLLENENLGDVSFNPEETSSPRRVEEEDQPPSQEDTLDAVNFQEEVVDREDEDDAPEEEDVQEVDCSKDSLDFSQEATFSDIQLQPAATNDSLISQSGSVASSSP